MKLLRFPIQPLTMLAYALLGSAAAGQEVREMTLKECVLLALQEDFDLKIRRIGEEIAEARVGLAFAAYEPALNMSVDHSDTTSPGGIDTRTGAFVNSETQSERITGAVSGLTPSGGSYSLGSSLSQTDGDRGGLPFETASGQVFVEWRQPLLKNREIDNTRLTIQMSKQNYDIAGLNLTQAMLESVNQVEFAFFDLIAARENVKVQETALTLAEELSKDTQKRVAAGALAPLDEAEARSQTAASKAAVISAKRLVIARQNVLKGAMVNDFPGWQPVTIAPQHHLTTELTDLDPTVSWRRALAQRPDVRSLELQVDQKHLVERYQRNQTLPDLSLTTNAGLSGSTNDVGGVFKQLGDREAPYYSLGLSLSLPLGNRRERQIYKIAQAESEQARVTLSQYRQAMMIQLDDSIAETRSAYERLGATREAREFAEQALANERGKLDRGSSTSFVVLQLQRNLTVAQSDEIQSLTDYSKALARVRFLEGTNLEPYQVQLEVAP